jgi:THO complex subunit 4
MSGKLDQSLDEILSTNKRSVVRGKGRGNRRVSQPGRAAAVAAPVGGVKKNLRQAKGAVKAAPTGPAGASGDSRIQVSNLVGATELFYLEYTLILVNSRRT